MITGLSGFFGSRMAKRLVEVDANVFGLLRSRADVKVPHYTLLLSLGKELRLVEDELESRSSIGSAITACSKITSPLAARSFVPLSFQDPNETMLCNCRDHIEGCHLLGLHRSDWRRRTGGLDASSRPICRYYNYRPQPGSCA
jgi:GDP-D-mannose dehydratase